MQKSTLLKSMILRQEILVMPGAHDPISARLIERAGFEELHGLTGMDRVREMERRYATPPDKVVAE